MIKENNTGFTLVEVLIVIAVLSILSTVIAFDFISFRKTSNLDNNVQEFVSVLKLAQNKSLSSENYSKYGVYINTVVSPNQYTLFAGDTYASNPSSYHIYYLQNNAEFYGISMGGGNEIVFDKLTGASEESGSVSIRINTDVSNNKTVYITSSGMVSLNPSTGLLNDNRVTDSRHIQFNYRRNIDTANETITLTFDDSVTKPIKISSYLVGDQLQWQGTVSVGGIDQTVEVSTHTLNSPDTLFSIHRDGRYNSKSLKITISGDNSGYLIQYSADGLVTDYSSINVLDFEKQ